MFTLNFLGDVARDATTQLIAASALSAVSVAKASLGNLNRRNRPFIFNQDADEEAHIEAQARQHELESGYYASLDYGFAQGAQVGW